MTTATSPAPAPTPTPGLPSMSRPVLGWTVHDAVVVTRRNLIQTWRVPELLFFLVLQPIMFVLLFAFVFGGAIPVPGGDYKAYLIPGVIAQTVAFAAASSTVGLAEDMSKGIIDRFRSLPMAAPAVLLGRTFADALRNVLVLVVLSITGIIIGWRITGGFWNAVAAYLLFLLFGYVTAWIGTFVGLHMPNVETANTAGLIWLFPVTFISNAFVPITGMPQWLQVVAEWNPVSAVTAAGRELFGNPSGYTGDAWPMLHPVQWTLISSVILLAVFVPLSIRRYRQTTSR